MATIEPVKKTVVQEWFVLTYERSELEAILDSPKAWLNDIRHALNGKAMLPLKSARAAKKPLRQAAVRSAGTGKNGARVNGRKAKGSQAKADDGEKPFRCRHCPREFKTQGWLNQHEARQHAGGGVDIGTYGLSGDD